ncbi:hypothetical protein C7447_102476 [Tenacibaculum adriaticum]|uniref:Carboxypeptidase-like protein n=1 Tax=Tenacibaculum adriaticum TaxID=413713 RepID=A0A5S5DTF8_9FLAO|nr:carboxypeptidase-like regulatory domain-containing protein [Tenacibaculum adriaticum]TYP99157.1 hypothetical protein C7447_102476 [Tenacibaculum adriaticum]
MKQKLLFILLLIFVKSFSQDKRNFFYGKIYDDLGVLANAHIINLNTKQATYSNNQGKFRVFASINDSLKVTSVGYKTTFLLVKTTHFGINENKINLEKEIYELDEVFVKNNNLSGSLETDFKQTPKDLKGEALTKTMDFSKVNMKAKTSDDYIDQRVRPNIVRTDPNLDFVGAGVGFVMPFKYSERLWALRKDLAFKKSIPAKLLSELGEKFFFEELKIPIEKYYHFLEYCNPLGIEKLYKNGNVLEVIKILRKEHVQYLELIKKE